MQKLKILKTLVTFTCVYEKKDYITYILHPEKNEIRSDLYKYSSYFTRSTCKFLKFSFFTISI